MEIDELDGMAAAGPSQGDQRSGETSDEEEAVLPTILQTMHHSLDDQSDDGDDGEDEGDDEGEDDHGDCNDEDDGEEDDAEEVNFHQAEEYDDDADVSEEGGPAPPAVPVPPSLPPPRDHPTIDIGLGQQIFPTTARPVASMAPVSMNQVLADTTRTPAKRRRAKTGGKARAKGKRGKGKLPPDVSRMLGEANMCYVSQDFQQAIRMLEEVVRRVPRVADPYHTLGLVYEEMDDQKRALECFLIAAYLTGKDVETWKRVATMSHEQGLLKQAIYCINRALRLAPGDVNAQYTRATVLVDLGQLKKGSEAYRTILKMRPHDAAVAAEMARLYTKNKESAQAIKVLNDCLQHNIALASGDVVDFAKEQERAANNALTPAKLPPSAKGQLLDEDEDPEETIGDDRPVAEANGKDSIPDPQPYLNAQLHLCNILAELFMSKGKFAETISVIEDLQKRGVCGTAATPLDLAVKCGICKVYIGKPEGAEEQFLRLHAEDVSTYPDLYFDVAEALLAIDSHQRALDFYEPLLKLNEYNQPAIWLKVGRCHLCLCSGDQASTSGQGRSGKDSGSALRYYTKVLQTAPNNSEAAVAIASLHVANNKPDTALRLLDQVFDQIDMVSVEAPPGFGPSTAISTQDDQHPHPQLVAVPVDTNGLQLLVERARLLHFFNRFDEFLNLVLVHIHRAVHALVPLPRSQTEQPVVSVQGRKRKVGSSTSFDGGTGSYPTLADVLTDRSLMILGAKAATIMVRYVSHWIVVADVRGVNRRVDGAMIECVAEIVLNTAWDHTGTCVSRKCDYEAVRGTINGLLRLHGRAAKPPKTDVASSALPAASKGSDSPALFAAISYPSDEDDQEDDDEDKEQDNGDKEEESANKADRLAADASRRRGEGVRRGGDKRSARHTKDGAAVDKLRLLLIGVAYILNDFETAYANIRDVCELRPSSTFFWNLYNTILIHCQSIQPEKASSQSASHRFLIKLLTKHPDSVPLMMLVAHHCAITRNLGLGIAEYLRARSLRPNDPLISLCLGTSYLCQVMQKNTYNRHLVCLKAFTFMNQYASLRAPGFKLSTAENDRQIDQLGQLASHAVCSDGEIDPVEAESKNLLGQEAAFNLGRAYQQLNLMHLAVPYYEHALKLATAQNERAAAMGAGAGAPRATSAPVGLQREAAYNLFLIYRSHKNSERLAREILRRHLTI